MRARPNGCVRRWRRNRHSPTQSCSGLARCFQRGDYPGSSEAFRNRLKKRPDWPAAQLNLGLALWKSGNRDEARQKLEAVNGSFGSEALHSLAMIAAEREDYQ